MNGVDLPHVLVSMLATLDTALAAGKYVALSEMPPLHRRAAESQSGDACPSRL